MTYAIPHTLTATLYQGSLTLYPNINAARLPTLEVSLDNEQESDYLTIEAPIRQTDIRIERHPRINRFAPSLDRSLVIEKYRPTVMEQVRASINDTAESRTVYRTAPQRFSGLRGRALLAEISDLATRGHQTRSYDAARAAIFSEIDNVVVDGVRGVYSSYSDIFVPGSFSRGGSYRERGDQNNDGYIDSKGMNVEHIWPQSYFNRRSPMRADVHHLLPTFMHPNSRRGRLPFGEVGDSDVVYQTNSGTRGSNHLFEPHDAVKGQVARALFYFFARYQNGDILPSNAHDVFWNRSLEILMKWNREFPPDAWEIERNNRIEEFQGNRNPFVDDYRLVDLVGLDTFRM